MTWLVWTGFILFVLAMLALDLGVFHRKAHVVRVKEALAWSGVWVLLALAFSAFIYFGYEHHWLGLGNTPDAADRSPEFPGGKINNGSSAVVKYLTGYVVEKSLSVDNIFVIAMLFAFFGVPALYQHRVLFWGILGALVMRGAMIAVGSALVARFHWVLYVFGAFLILTAVKMLFLKEGESDPSKNVVVRYVRRFFPVTERLHGEHFAVRAGSDASHAPPTPGATEQADAAVDHARAGRWMLTPLALALVMIETTDLLFAVDSIPAIFGVTADPFLVFTSNVFAILGLRSLYFALAGMIDKFQYLKPALAVILALVGVKMLTEHWTERWLGGAMDFYFLGLVMLILLTGVAVSALVNRRRAAREPAFD